MLMRQRNSGFPTILNDQESSSLRFSEMIDKIMEDAWSLNSGTFVPELNVYENEKEFKITVALPGMRKEDITINYEDNTITISGERELKEEEGTKYHRIESRFGKFERSLPLPNVIDEENISANYENGVLTVTVPKLKEKAGKRIDIQ